MRGAIWWFAVWVWRLAVLAPYLRSEDWGGFQEATPYFVRSRRQEREKLQDFLKSLFCLSSIMDIFSPTPRWSSLILIVVNTLSLGKNGLGTVVVDISSVVEVISIWNRSRICRYEIQWRTADPRVSTSTFEIKNSNNIVETHYQSWRNGYFFHWS